MNSIEIKRSENGILYSITEEDLQYEAKRILGRELNDAEVLRGKKLLEFGIGESINVIYQSIFSEIINI